MGTPPVASQFHLNSRRLSVRSVAYVWFGCVLPLSVAAMLLYVLLTGPQSALEIATCLVGVIVAVAISAYVWWFTGVFMIEGVLVIRRLLSSVSLERALIQQFRYGYTTNYRVRVEVVAALLPGAESHVTHTILVVLSKRTAKRVIAELYNWCSGASLPDGSHN